MGPINMLLFQKYHTYDSQTYSPFLIFKLERTKLRNLQITQVAESMICALEQLRYKDDSDEEDTLSDSIRDYAYSLTAPQACNTPNTCSPISPAIVRKSVSLLDYSRFVAFGIVCMFSFIESNS